MKLWKAIFAERFTGSTAWWSDKTEWWACPACDHHVVMSISAQEAACNNSRCKFYHGGIRIPEPSKP